jgi:hypothetical protein
MNTFSEFAKDSNILLLFAVSLLIMLIITIITATIFNEQIDKIMKEELLPIYFTNTTNTPTTNTSIQTNDPVLENKATQTEVQDKKPEENKQLKQTTNKNDMFFVNDYFSSNKKDK